MTAPLRLRTRYPGRTSMAGYLTTLGGIFVQGFSFVCLHGILKDGALLPGLYALPWVVFPYAAFGVLQSVGFALLLRPALWIGYLGTIAVMIASLLNLALAFAVLARYGFLTETFLHRGLALPLFLMVAIALGLPFQIRLLRDPWWKLWLPEPAQRP